MEQRNALLEAISLALNAAGWVVFIAIVALFAVGLVFALARDAWNEMRGTS